MTFDHFSVLPHERYFEHYQAGREYDLGTLTVSEAEIVEFASRYDPQDFHLSREKAANSPYGGIIGRARARLWRAVPIPEGAARFCQSGQQGTRFPSLPVGVAKFANFLVHNPQTNLVGVMHWPAAERQEAVSMDMDHVDLRRT